MVSYNEITFDISCETEQGIDSVRFQDTDHYRTTVRFLQNPESAMEDILGIETEETDHGGGRKIAGIPGPSGMPTKDTDKPKPIFLLQNRGGGK